MIRTTIILFTLILINFIGLSQVIFNGVDLDQMSEEVNELFLKNVNEYRLQLGKKESISSDKLSVITTYNTERMRVNGQLSHTSDIQALTNSGSECVQSFGWSFLGKDEALAYNKFSNTKSVEYMANLLLENYKKSLHHNKIIIDNINRFHASDVRMNLIVETINNSDIKKFTVILYNTYYTMSEDISDDIEDISWFFDEKNGHVFHEPMVIKKDKKRK